MEEKEVLLTQEGYEKLEKELEYLVTEKQFYDLWSVSSLFGSRIVILPRESLTRPSP